MILIKLPKSHYIVVDNSEIQEGDKSLLKVKGFEPMILTHFEPVEEGYEGKKITHSTQPLEKTCCTPKGKRKTINCMDCPKPYLGFDKIKPLSLSEVEEAINGYNVEKIAESKWGELIVNLKLNTLHKGMWCGGYQHGFKAHQELVKDKLFTVEDMKKAILAGSMIEKLTMVDSTAKECLDHYPKQEQQIIRSLLPKTEWDIDFDEQGKIKLL